MTSNDQTSNSDKSNFNDKLSAVPDWLDGARLAALVVIIVFGWLLVWWMVPARGPDRPSVELLKDLKENFQGITPAIGACYALGSNAAAVIIAVAIGLALGVSYVFGTFLYKLFRLWSSRERQLFWGAVEDRIRSSQVDLREIIIEFREYEKLMLDRRNIFWSLFARVTLAILVVGLIALLISTCKVESQAGLPIISGIIAFIIGQGSELVHAAAAPIVVASPKPDPENKPSTTRPVAAQ